MNFAVLSVRVDAMLCKVRFLRWRRSHRKSRINKKWHKKYGAITGCVNVDVYRVGGALLMCPCCYRRLEQAVEL